jgi:hypothetical protein
MGLMDAPQDVHKPSFLGRWRRSALWLQLLVILAMSIGILFAGYGCGRAIDCSPGQQDGQCGLGTFMGIVNGVGFGGVFLLVASSLTVTDWFRKRRQPEGK